MSRADPPPFDALILAGGKASRLGGADKAELVLSGRRLIDRVLDATGDARRVVVVGPQRHTDCPVSWVREEPPGGGPVAALAAGLRLVEAARALVLAVDLPLLDRELVRELVAAAARDHAAVTVDRDGRLQPLLACYPTEPLRAALSERASPGSMMSLLESLRYVRIHDRGRSRDCDTLGDLHEMRIGIGGGGET